MNFSIRQKIFLSYIVMIAFTMVVGIYAIYTLKSLNNITTTILFNYATVSEKLTNMNDSALAQDLYEKRYLMLRENDAENMFWDRGREFNLHLAELAKAGVYESSMTGSISENHQKYNMLFTKEVSLVREGRDKEAEQLSSNDLKTAFAALLASLNNMDLKVKAQQNYYIIPTNKLIEKSLMITALLSVFSLVFGILFA